MIWAQPAQNRVWKKPPLCKKKERNSTHPQPTVLHRFDTVFLQKLGLALHNLKAETNLPTKTLYLIISLKVFV